MDDTVAHKVFSIPELLELIMMNIEPDSDRASAPQGRGTLLHAQRVSKTFQAVIKDSAKLQRSLFFAQDPEPATLPTTSATFRPPHTTIRRPKTVSTDELRIHCHYTTADEPGGLSCHFILNRGPEHEAEEQNMTQAQNLLTGSWRRMYVDQRSYEVESVTICWMANSKSLHSWHAKDSTRQNMTLGQIFDLMMDNDRGGGTRRVILEPWVGRKPYVDPQPVFS